MSNLPLPSGGVTTDTPGAATYTGTSTSFLEKARCTGDGPRYVKIGRAVRYRFVDLDTWLESCARRSTSDRGQKAA